MSNAHDFVVQRGPEGCSLLVGVLIMARGLDASDQWYQWYKAGGEAEVEYFPLITRASKRQNVSGSMGVYLTAVEHHYLPAHVPPPLALPRHEQ